MVHVIKTEKSVKEIRENYLHCCSLKKGCRKHVKSSVVDRPSALYLEHCLLFRRFGYVNAF